MQYEKISKYILSGDVILWKGNHLISRAIRLFSEYSHASLILRLNEFEGLKDRRFVLEAVNKGITINLLSEAFKEHGEAYLFSLKEEHNDKRDQIISWAMGKMGTPYDFHGVFRNIFGRVSSDVKRLFCSEYVYESYKEAGIVGEQKAPRPGDLAKWDCFEEPIAIANCDR